MTTFCDRVVLKVIPFSSLLNTHRNVSRVVWEELPGVNDMLTCRDQPAVMQSVTDHMLHATLGMVL